MMIRWRRTKRINLGINSKNVSLEDHDHHNNYIHWKSFSGYSVQ